MAPVVVLVVDNTVHEPALVLLDDNQLVVSDLDDKQQQEAPAAGMHAEVLVDRLQVVPD